MLQHMVEAEKLNLVFCGVDFIVRVLEVRLDDEGRWVASFRRGSVVGTCIPAFRKNVRNVAILARRLATECSLYATQGSYSHLSNHLFDKFRQGRVYEIRDDSDAFGLSRFQGFPYESCHILLQHRLHIPSGLFVR